MIQSIDKFIFPGLLILLGILLLSFGVSDEQTSWFLIGAVALLAAGIITALYQAGFINRQISMVLGLLFLAGSVALSWMDYRSVQGEIEQAAYNKLKNGMVVQGLKDLRTAQIAYKAEHGAYTEEEGKLKDFISNGKITLIKAIGQVPDTLSEQEAIEMGIVRRDTSFVNAQDSLFLSPFVQEGRKFPFTLDSLMIARMSEGEKFNVKTGSIRSSGRNLPVIEIKEPVPINRKEPLMVGNLERASTAGNWKDVN